MDKPTQIVKDGKTLNFTYGPQHMRFKQVNGSVTTFYSDKLYEEEIDGTNTTWRAYIDDIAVISQTTHEGAAIRYTHRDRLGSARVFTDHNGQVEAERNYDPFGKPRLASGGLKNPAKEDDLEDTKTRRGFTDHEHLDNVELIHMNGRVYDYNLGRFMSVDPFIHLQGGSQGINPYSYIMNNPLSGTDPTGYLPETAEFDVDDIKNIEIYEDGSITVNFNNGAESASFSNVTISDGVNTVDIGSQVSIAKRDAAIAQDVYSEKSTFGKDSNLQRLGQEKLEELGLDGLDFNDDESGFQSALYHDSERDEYIYAFAGTQDAKDWAANGAQIEGEYSKQHDLAQYNTGIIRQSLGVNSDNLSTTGHSLGGGLASLSAMKYSLRSSTFNAAGLHHNSIHGFRANNGSTTNIMAYYFEYDIVSRAQDLLQFAPAALGNRVMLQPAFNIRPTNQGDWLRAHGIDEIRNSLDRL